MSEAPLINLRPPTPNVYYKGSEHLFVRRLGVEDLGDSRSMRGILADVAWRHGIAPHVLRGDVRARWAAHPRQEAMYLMYQTGRFSLPQIGIFLGNRDHTTVLHGIRAHKKRREEMAKAAAE